MLQQAKSIVRRVLRPRLHIAEREWAYCTLGSQYGGWPLLLQTPPSPLIFSFGVGEDATFDLAAIERFGATVHAFDPTPRSLRWVERQNFPERFIFHNVGLAAEDGVAEFFAPEQQEYVSYSARPGANSDRALAVTAPVERLSTVVARLGLGIPDVVKMDIEGFEYDVLDDMIASGIHPRQLLVEFHHRMYGISSEQTMRQVERLRSAGYRLFYVAESGHEYGFFHTDADA
jgi:FkbM family methyltransferase